MILRTSLALITLSTLLLACGGSASETPWPVPPTGAALGPAGEAAGPTDLEDSAVTNEREDPGGDAAPKGEGRSENNPQQMRR